MPFGNTTPVELDPAGFAVTKLVLMHTQEPVALESQTPTRTFWPGEKEELKRFME